MENNEYRIKMDEQDESKRIARFMLQKKKTNIVFAVVAVAAMIYFHTIPVLIVGGIVIAVVAANFVIVKDRPVLDMYPEYFIVPNASNIKEGFKIRYEEVEEYYYDSESWGGTVFVLRLKDDTTFAIPSDNQSIMTEFKKIIPNAEKYKKIKNDMAERRAKRKANRKK